MSRVRDGVGEAGRDRECGGREGAVEEAGRGVNKEREGDE